MAYLSHSTPKHLEKRRNGREQGKDNPQSADKPKSGDKLTLKTGGGTSSVYFSLQARHLYDSLPAILRERKAQMVENALREYAQRRGIDVEQLGRDA